MLDCVLDYLMQMGWSPGYAALCLGLHFALSSAGALLCSLTLTILSPSLWESRTGASFMFLLSAFLGLLLHVLVDFGYLSAVGIGGF